LLALGTLTLTSCSSEQVPIDAPQPTSDAAESACRALVEGLPDTVDDKLRRPVHPEDALGAAWGDDPAIILTCGGEMPESFSQFAQCEVADGVGWYAEEDVAADQSVPAIITTVGFEPTVTVVIPARDRPAGVAATMIDLAPALTKHLDLVKPCV
jgi:hypothetical protein